MTTLGIEQLSKSYGDFKAVNNISLEVGSGEIYGFLGMNGAGKTTTLKMAVGLLHPCSGTINICGSDISKDPITCKQHFGYIPDRPYMYPKLTAYEFLTFIGDLYDLPRETSLERAKLLLDEFGLSDKANFALESFSHGMKQRVAIVAGLIHKPRLLIIDEPMVGLDPFGAKMLKASLKNYVSDGNSVFISTHSLDVAQDICDRLAIIQHGTIIAKGTYEELRSKNNPEASRLEDVFLSITSEQ